jgi:Zn-dependent protease with chaperone function
VVVFATATLPADTGTQLHEAVAVPRPSPLAMRYYQSGNWLWLVREFWTTALPAAIFVTGLSARLRAAVERHVGGPNLVAIIYLAAYLALVALLGLPLSCYAGYVRQHAYGLSTQSPGRWLGHWGVGVGVQIFTAALFGWIPFAVMRRFPRQWWLVTGALVVPFLFLVAMVKPIWVDPLLNRYGPMRDQALEATIQSLARRAGIAGSRVFEVDMSRDTKAVNAYVTGFLGTKRIVLWDTMIDSLEPDELLVVMGHEMGHYVLGHLARGLLFTALLVLIGLWLVDRAARAILARLGTRVGVTHLADPGSTPLILAVAHLVSLVLIPVGFTYSRAQEHEADRFALELTRANHAAATAMVKLQRENLGNPRPGWFYTVWRGTHPSAGERIDFANSYRPWESGGQMWYAGHFKPALSADGTP